MGGRQYERDLVHSGQPYAVPPTNTWVIGPEVINNTNRAVILATEATELDGGLFDPSELSGLRSLQVLIPVGSGNEVVPSTPFVIDPFNRGELEYKIEGSYQIDYVP